LPQSSQARVASRIFESTSWIVSGTLNSWGTYSFGSFSFQRQPFLGVSSFVVGKYSCAIVSLYAKGDRVIGKYSPYSPVDFMCSMIFVRRVSNSSFSYSLLKMQNFLFLIPTQPKMFWLFLVKNEYSISRE